jgi:hypothetical protein
VLERRREVTGRGVGVYVKQLPGGLVPVPAEADRRDYRQPARHHHADKGRCVHVYDFADEAERLVPHGRFQHAGVTPGEADCRDAEGRERGHQLLVDEAGEDRDHNIQRGLVRDPQPPLEARRDIEALQPFGDQSAAAVQDDDGLAAMVKLRHVGQRRVVAAEG